MLFKNNLSQDFLPQQRKKERANLGPGVEALVEGGEEYLPEVQGAGVGILGGHQLIQQLLRQRRAVLVVLGHQPAHRRRRIWLNLKIRNESVGDTFCDFLKKRNGNIKLTK